MVLCFYDTGAQMSLIETALARSLKLQMIRREGFLLVGAGNHVTYTDDGTYELVLGSSRDEEIFRISVSGMPILTGPMTYCNWKPIHAQVREQGEGLAQKSDSVRHLDKFLQPRESLPPMTGGDKVRLLIGLKLPSLQPAVIFHLPSGILVARARLRDAYGSNVVFGGVYNLFDAHTIQTCARFASAFQCNPYVAFNRRCYEEYIVFRNSVYPANFSLPEGKECEQRGLKEEDVRIVSNQSDSCLL